MAALQKRPNDYFKMFYADTALFGAKSASRCGLDFFGVDKLVFASDCPFDPENGTMFIRETIKIVDELDISQADRQEIYHDNILDLTRLQPQLKGFRFPLRFEIILASF